MTATTVLVDGYCFLESPRWRNHCLYASDIRGGQVIRIHSGGKVDVLAEMESPCGLGWLTDGRLLIVAMESRRIMRLEHDGSLSVHADLSSFAKFPLNDMVVDRSGRAFVGQWGYDVIAKAPPLAVPILRADPDGQVSDAGGEILLANGVVVSPDQKSLFMVETEGGRISAFDLAPDGTLSRQRNWADLHMKRPDGICLDQGGGIWVADIWGACFQRVVEGGQVTDRVDVPGRLAASCALGGPDGRTLFLATTTGRSDKIGALSDRGGRIEMVQVAIPGCECP